MQQPWKLGVLLTSVVFLVATASYGQSLGDVARENRQKQQQKNKDQKDASTPHKVITNEDIPESEDSSASESEDSSSGNKDDPASDSSTESSSAVTKSGEQWKTAILAQKNAIASMQSQLDKLNSSIHFVEANRYTNGVQYNQYQLQKQKQAEQAQKRLDEMKKKLEDMQESARKAGFGSVVYDP
jgi:tetrahydromethanopterin S-methyltransferase subunit G